MFDAFHWVGPIWRSFTLGLLIVVMIFVSGCQAASQTAPAPSPTPTLELAATPDAAYTFGSLSVGLENDTIWLLVEDEAPRLLTHGWGPLISPDGRWVMVGRPPGKDSHTSAYWLIHTSDGAERLLLSPEAGNNYLMYDRAWSPDSRHVAFTCGGDIKRMYAGDLWQVDIADGTVTQIAEHDAGEPYFSPDGEWVATSTPEIGYSHGSIALWHVASKENRVLFAPLFLLYLEWADDSSGFAAAFQPSGKTDLELWWVPVDAAPVQLGHLPYAYAAWQPNTERLAYYSPKYSEEPDSEPGYSLHTIHLVNRDGSEDEIIPDSEGMLFCHTCDLGSHNAPLWSPDGRWLLLVDRNYHPYIVDTYALNAPIRLSVDYARGWVDATHYLASTYQDNHTTLYRCVPPETCQPLAQFEGWLSSLSYTQQVYRP